MAKLQERMNKHGLKYIVGLQNTVRALWRKACEFDGVTVDAKFVVFSDGNKFARFLDNAQTQLIEARDQYRVGGYVGLRVNSRKI